MKRGDSKKKKKSRDRSIIEFFKPKKPISQQSEELRSDVQLINEVVREHVDARKAYTIKYKLKLIRIQEKHGFSNQEMVNKYRIGSQYYKWLDNREELEEFFSCLSVAEKNKLCRLPGGGRTPLFRGPAVCDIFEDIVCYNEEGKYLSQGVLAAVGRRVAKKHKIEIKDNQVTTGWAAYFMKKYDLVIRACSKVRECKLRGDVLIQAMWDYRTTVVQLYEFARNARKKLIIATYDETSVNQQTPRTTIVPKGTQEVKLAIFCNEKLCFTLTPVTSNKDPQHPFIIIQIILKAPGLKSKNDIRYFERMRNLPLEELKIPPALQGIRIIVCATKSGFQNPASNLLLLKTMESLKEPNEIWGVASDCWYSHHMTPEKWDKMDADDQEFRKEQEDIMLMFMQNDFHDLAVPSNCTGYTQLLDIVGNSQIKSHVMFRINEHNSNQIELKKENLETRNPTRFELIQWAIEGVAKIDPVTIIFNYPGCALGSPEEGHLCRFVERVRRKKENKRLSRQRKRGSYAAKTKDDRIREVEVVLEQRKQDKLDADSALTNSEIEKELQDSVKSLTEDRLNHLVKFLVEEVVGQKQRVHELTASENMVVGLIAKCLWMDDSIQHRYVAEQVLESLISQLICQKLSGCDDMVPTIGFNILHSSVTLASHQLSSRRKRKANRITVQKEIDETSEIGIGDDSQSREKRRKVHLTPIIVAGPAGNSKKKKKKKRKKRKKKKTRTVKKDNGPAKSWMNNYDMPIIAAELVERHYCVMFGHGGYVCRKCTKRFFPDDDAIFQCGNCFEFFHTDCTADEDNSSCDKCFAEL